MKPTPTPRAKRGLRAVGRPWHGARVGLALFAWIGLAGCSLLPHPAPEAKPVVRGPLPTRTQHPMALTYLGLRPRRAATQPVDRLGVGFLSVYSSIFEKSSTSDEEIRFDGELWRNSLRMRKGITSEMDVEVELAALYTTSGFLDDIVETYHELLHLPQGGRSNAEDDQYSMQLQKNGQTIYDLDEDTVGFCDVPVILTRRLRAEDEDGPGVAARLGVELPTGSEQRGFGNGKLDWGGGLLAERSFDRWTATGGIDYVFTGRPDDFEGSGVDAKNILQVASGLEYRWSDVTSCLGEIVWTTPMVDDFSEEEINEDIVTLSLGVVRDLDPDRGSRLTFSFHEDLVSATGPDFAVLAGIAWGL